MCSNSAAVLYTDDALCREKSRRRFAGVDLQAREFHNEPVHYMEVCNEDDEDRERAVWE